ncbi:FecCD family ABC transporter permease [Vibrio profundi]|uniref:FecCD family ABC transporter permease n=1 Tax=Vibrio profundi TaxID=1774960 RepID=UPI003736F8FA
MSLYSQRKLAILCGTIFCLLFMLFCFIASLLVGKTAISLDTLFDAIIHYSSSNQIHSFLLEERLPRAITALVVGASLASSGVLLQVLVKSPLASPSLISVNSGALVFSVIAVSVLTITLLEQVVMLACIGAVLALAAIYLLDRSSGSLSKPVKTLFTGLVLTVLALTITALLLITTNGSWEDVVFWLAGSVSQHSIQTVVPLLPLLVFAIGVTWLITPYLNQLMEADTMDKQLGYSTTIIRLLIAICIAIFASISVVMAGFIGFVGLMVPYLIRKLANPDFKWLLPISALLGASLLLAIDTASRYLSPAHTIPIGIGTALIGVPFVGYLIWRSRKNTH